MHWKIRDRQLNIDRVLLMGILNVTPDSFSDGAQFASPEDAFKYAMDMIDSGADILDLGAESTRPHAEFVHVKEELDRLLPVLKKIRHETNIPISIDTTKPEVAKACLAEGADIINDVSGLKDSGYEMARLVKDSGAGIVLMHRRGNPETMQSMTEYDHLTEEVICELKESVNFALEAGIEKDQIVLDPGIGFAKTAEQNLELTAKLERFKKLGYPVLYGPSRKSFIGHVTGKAVTERAFGTAAVSAIAVLKGAKILRVHEVSAMRDVALMAEAVQNFEKQKSPLF